MRNGGRIVRLRGRRQPTYLAVTFGTLALDRMMIWHINRRVVQISESEGSELENLLFGVLVSSYMPHSLPSIKAVQK